jgi:hypothetical protein
MVLPKNANCDGQRCDQWCNDKNDCSTISFYTSVCDTKNKHISVDNPHSCGLLTDCCKYATPENNMSPLWVFTDASCPQKVDFTCDYSPPPPPRHEHEVGP